MADHEGNAGGGGIPGFAYAEALGNHFQELSKDANIAVPGVVLASILAFLCIIGLSWVMDGKTTWPSVGATTPKKKPQLGLEETPAGRRSTRKSNKPQILDPSQLSSR